MEADWGVVPTPLELTGSTVGAGGAVTVGV